MKSFVAVVNTTAAELSVGSVKFTSGVPAVIYRDCRVFGASDFGRFVAYLSAGDLVGFDFDGDQLEPAEAIETANRLRGGVLNQEQSYSPGWHWRRASCEDLLDGLCRNLLLFDFDGEGVTRSKHSTLLQMLPVVTYLAAGFIEAAVVEIDNAAPDGDDDFLSASRLERFRALFASAAHD